MGWYCRNAYTQTAIINIFNYNRICAYYNVIANFNISKHLGSRTNKNVVSEFRGAFFAKARSADKNTMAERTIFSGRNLRVDSEAAKTADPQPGADISACWQINAKYDFYEKFVYNYV